MTDAPDGAAVVAQAAIVPPRLVTELARPNPTHLDGGWWPRSRDPLLEVPGLVQALDKQLGTIRRLMLRKSEWDAAPLRLIIDGRVVKIGWYVSQPPGLLIATADSGVRVDLLVVPPSSGQEAADAVMRAAVDATNVTRTPELLAEMVNEPAHQQQESNWENEGGGLSRVNGRRDKTPQPVG